MATPTPFDPNDHSKPEIHPLNSRQFKGVRMRKWGKWVSEIRMPNSGGRIWLGSYDTPEKAARAYDFAVYYLRGSKAKLNFPDSPPEIPCNSDLSPQQIQAEAAKFSAQEFRLASEDGAACSSFDLETKCDIEEFRLASEDGAACSSSNLETKCDIDGQQITAEQSPAFCDLLSLEVMENCDSPSLEDFPALDVSLEDFGCYQRNPPYWPLTTDSDARATDSSSWSVLSQLQLTS